MSNRLSKIYTRTGDKGTTSLASGKRVDKSELIFEVMGDIDELNAHIGMAQCLYQDNTNNDDKDTVDIIHTLSVIQHLLFNVGGELAMWQSEYPYQGIEERYVAWLEQHIDNMNEDLQPLKEFILPAGSQSVCQLHIARTICRRAERHAILLISHSSDDPPLSQTSVCFLNRLSDWLFVACRFVGLQQADHNQQSEVLWNREVLNN